MRTYFYLLILILISCNAWSKTKLVELLKSGKNQYRLDSDCRNFIQSSTDSTFRIPELQKLLIKNKDLPSFDNLYFHYTNSPLLSKILKGNIKDRSEAQKQIIKDGGYRSILEYQMTYDDALSNIAGVGFYVASNPFSSSNYGTIQVALKISPSANVLPYEEKKSEVELLVQRFRANHPLFAACTYMIQLSVLMSENDVDLFAYDSAREWFVVFNEDVIQESKLTQFHSQTNLDIFQALVKDGAYDSAFEYVRELNPSGKYLVSTIGTLLKAMDVNAPSVSNTIEQLTEKIPEWTPVIKEGFASYVSSLSGKEMTTVMDVLRKKGNMEDEIYLQISYDNSSKDFLKYISSVFVSNPGITASWKEKYHARMTPFLASGVLSPGFYVQRLPPEAGKNFVRNLRNLNDSPELRTGIFKALIKARPDYLNLLDAEAKLQVAKHYIEQTDPKDITAVISELDGIKYETKALFDNYTLNALNEHKNSTEFLMQYILLKNDPALITDQLAKSLARLMNSANIGFFIELKKRPGVFGKRSEVLLSHLLLHYADFSFFLKPENRHLYSVEDQQIILARTLKLAPVHFSNFQKVFNPAPKDIVAAIKKDVRLNDESLKIALAVIMQDKTVSNSYLDLTNSEGVSAILENGNLIESQKYLVEVGGLQFYRALLGRTSNNNTVRHVLVKNGERDKYFGQLTPNEQVKVLGLFQYYEDKSYKTYLAKVQLTPTIAKELFTSLKNSNYRGVLVEDLLNNLVFVRSLNHEELLDILRSNGARYVRMNLDALFGSDLMTPERVSILLIGLGDYYNKPNIKLVYDTHVRGMNDEEKTILASFYAKYYVFGSNTTHEMLWDELLPIMTEKGYLSEFSKSFTSLPVSRRKPVLNYILSSDQTFLEAMDFAGSIEKGFIPQVIELRDRELAVALFGLIEKNYPVKENYARWLIFNRQNYPTLETIFAPHFEKFVCKKVKGHHAFAEVIGKEQSKYYIKQLKELRKTMCNWNGFF